MISFVTSTSYSLRTAPGGNNQTHGPMALWTTNDRGNEEARASDTIPRKVY